jgi:hypothetical protein
MAEETNARAPRPGPLARFVRRFTRPIQHSPGDQKLYGEAVDQLLRHLRDYVKEGEVEQRSQQFWAEMLKFLDEYHKFYQGYPDIEEVIRFLGRKIADPKRLLDAPPRLHVPTSAILGPQKI